MLYTVLSLFFVPTFKWNRRYYVQSTCCGTTYELNPEIGRQIARGENVEILSQHLNRVDSGGLSGWFGRWKSACKHCQNCGYETAEDFDFCPKCGMRF